MTSPTALREKLAAELRLDFYIDDDQTRAYLLDFVCDLLQDHNLPCRKGELIIFKGLFQSGKTSLAKKINSILQSNVKWAINTPGGISTILPSYPFYGRNQLLNMLTVPLVILDSEPKIIEASISRREMMDMDIDGDCASPIKYLLGDQPVWSRIPGEMPRVIFPSCNVIYICNEPPEALIRKATKKGAIIDFQRNIPEIRETLRFKLSSKLMPDLANIICSFY